MNQDNPARTDDSMHPPLRGVCLLAGLIILLLMIGTFNRNEDWQSAHRLWLNIVAESPLKQRPRVNLAWAYQQEGDYYNAQMQYDNALKLYPETPGMGRTNRMFIAMNMGQLYIQLHDYDRASEALANAWNLAPGHPGIALNLSKIIFETGALHSPQQVLLAINILDVGIQRRDIDFRYFPEFDLSLLHANKAMMLRFINRCTDAQAEYRLAAKYNPAFTGSDRFECHNNISY